MKKTVKNLLNIIACFSLPMLLTISVSADTTPRLPGNYYLSEGVGHLDYYITPSISEYTSLIGVCANNWVNTSFGYNPIYMYHTTNFDVSNMDIYDAQEYQAYLNARGYDGMTIYISVTNAGHTRVSYTNSFWDYGVIYLNKSMWLRYGYTEADMRGVIIHEMGHVMALDHNASTTDSVMYASTDERATTVRKPDHDGINAIYS